MRESDCPHKLNHAGVFCQVVRNWNSKGNDEEVAAVSVQYIDRPPRIQPELPTEEREIPAPPDTEEKGGRFPVQALLPLVTIIGYVLISATGQGRNLMLMIPMGLSVVASTVFAVVSYNKEKGSGTKAADEYH